VARLTDKQDAYGHRVYDLWRGQNVCEVAECDDGFLGTGSVDDLAEYRQWPAHQRKAIRLARTLEGEGPTYVAIIEKER